MTRQQFRFLWELVGWAWIVVIIGLSVLPIPDLPGPELPFGDKLGHLGAYAAAMLWFSQLSDQRLRRSMVALRLIALGGSLELVQSWLPHREGDWIDMLADGLGVALGLALATTRAGQWFRSLEARLSS